ncbi:hypothetical protein AB7038_08420, partial [Morganella morganii]|uniref:hypothetical protein n=1 Tax=Morganella morganii TaxID=582 RepID=UPI0034E4FA54
AISSGYISVWMKISESEWDFFPGYLQTARSNPLHHVKRTTPHPPAVFGSENYFSFKILQTGTPDRATAGALQISCN